MVWVLVTVVLLLVLAAMLDAAPEPMVLAMGALNASLRRAGNIPVSLTFVTGVLVRFGQGLGDFLTGRATATGWLRQAIPWVGLMAGVILGTVTYDGIGEAAIWLPVGLAALLAACCAAMPEND